MPKYTIEMTVSGEVEFGSLEAAIEWCENHTVFDLLDKGASTSAATISAPQTHTSFSGVSKYEH